MINMGFTLPRSWQAFLFGAAVAVTIPVNTTLVGIGDSRMNATNIRGFREWFNYFCFAHFAVPAWYNQGVGGATLTPEAATEASSPNDYLRNRRGHYLAALHANAAAFLFIGTNDFARSTATLQKMKDEIDLVISEIMATGAWLILGLPVPSTANQQAGAVVTKYNDYCAYLLTKHNPAGRIIVIGATTNAGFNIATMTYDNLHDNALGAQYNGYSLAQEIKPYLENVSALTAWGPNIETQGDFTGTGGTIGVGIQAGGQVADGYSAYFNSNGGSGGTSVGFNAVASKIASHPIPGFGNVEAQKLTITGTPSGVCQALVNNIVSWAAQTPTRTEIGSQVETAFYVKVVLRQGYITAFGSALGSIGLFMLKNAIADVTLTQSFEGVLRQKPVVGLGNANTNTADAAINFPASVAIDCDFIVAALKVQKAEQTAYKLPFNQGQAMATGSNPIGDRPRFASNPVGGVAQNIQLGAASGGAVVPTITVRRDSDNVVLATYMPGSSPFSYAGVTGNVIYIQQDDTNSFGTVSTQSVRYTVG